MTAPVIDLIREWRRGLFGALGVGLLALITSGPASAATGDASADSFKIFAGELVIELDRATAGRGAEESLTIAVWPHPIGRTAVPATLAQEYNDRLLAALLNAGGHKYRFVARDSLRAVVSDISEATDLAESLDPVLDALARDARADVLIVCKLRLIGENSLQVSYRAVDVNDGTVLAATSHRRLAVAPADVGAAATALGLDQAVDQATEVLARRAPGLQTLHLDGIDFEESGQETPLGRYVEGRLADALVEAYENPLTGRTILLRHGTTEPAEQSGGLPPYPGAYHLSGRTWDFGEVIELRLSLRNGEELAAVWRDRIRVSSLPRKLRREPLGLLVAAKQPDAPRLVEQRTPAPGAHVVMEAQRDLRQLGYRPGPVDGVLGPQTRAAIRDYQRRHGLPRDGRLTNELVERLDQDALRQLARRTLVPNSPKSTPKLSAAVVPPGHLPPPGSCRIWYAGRAPSHQPPPAPCSALQGKVPPGAVLVTGGESWLAYRRARQSAVTVTTVSPTVDRVVPVASRAPASGRYCREVEQTVTIGGRIQRSWGIACRQSDGSWQFAGR